MVLYNISVLIKHLAPAFVDFYMQTWGRPVIMAAGSLGYSILGGNATNVTCEVLDEALSEIGVYTVYPENWFKHV